MAEMTPLRRRMIEDMQVRNLSPVTQRCYVHAVAKFAKHFNRSPVTSSSRSARLRRPAMLTSLDSLATTLSTSVLAAAGAWRCSARCRDHAQPTPRHGTTAHERRGLVPMVNRFAILAAGCPRGAGVTRHAARAAPLSLGAARTFGVAFVNGAPARRSPVTAPLPAGSRATRLLATSAFYSP